MLVVGIDASRAFRQQRTGVEEYAYRLLTAMARTTPERVRIRLYTQRSSPRATSRGLGSRNEIPRQARDDKIDWLPSSWELHVLPWPARLWTHTALAWELWRNPPDVFFQPSHVLPLSCTLYHVPCIKLVVTIHDVGFRRIPWAYPPFDRWYQHFTTKHEVRSTKYGVRVIVPSEFTKRELVELYHVAPERITVIPHATSPELSVDAYRENNNPLNPPYRKGEEAGKDPCGHPYILSIGRIEKKKNTLGMVKWFERKCLMTNDKFLMTDDLNVTTNDIRHLKLDISHYILVGPDGYGADEVYAYLAKRPELQARVHILGYVSEARKWELLRGAQALIHLSHYEGFGLPIAEARSLGIPIITNCGLRLPAGKAGITDYESGRTWEDVARETWKILLAPNSPRPSCEEGTE